MLLFLPCTNETATPLEGVLGSAGKEVKSTAECTPVSQLCSEQRTPEISEEADQRSACLLNLPGKALKLDCLYSGFKTVPGKIRQTRKKKKKVLYYTASYRVRCLR